MTQGNREGRIPVRWWTAILLAFIAALVFVTVTSYQETFRRYVPVTLTSDRTGLVMESGGKVKMRGVEIGRVATISGQRASASLLLEIDPQYIPYIPANVDAEIRATTAFGSKYVDLRVPEQPSTTTISKGAVLHAKNVSTEVNTVFENIVSVIEKIDMAKLNAVLAAVAEGVRGQGPAMGQAITDANQILLELNPRAETIREDWRSFGAFSDAYSGAAQDIVSILDAATTTSETIRDHRSDLDALLLNMIGFSESGIGLLAPHHEDLIRSINVLQPTTELLKKYDPVLTCTLLGAKRYLDEGGHRWAGGNGRTAILDVTLLLGDDPYRYPQDLPIVGAKGGPGGKPGCGSLPNVDENWPVRYLVTNTGWGTGIDVRPNPGIGFPGWVNYFPVTRPNPEPPSLRYQGGPAPGPIPYPGAPPYGAPLYAPDGAPLYPGLPPAPPPGAPREPGPTPGSEPYEVPVPAQVPVTPLPPPPQP